MSQNIILGIAGRKGSGKSTALRGLLERCPRLFVWDPMGEHHWLPNRFGRVAAVEQFFAWADTQKTFAGSYIPSREMPAYFERLSNLAYAHGRMVFAVEEVPLVCEPGFLSDGFDMAVRTGRHRNLSIVYTAQRLGEAARRLTAATDYFLLFGCSEPRDLAAIADRCGSDVAQKVAGLGLHGSLAWSVIERREASPEALGEALAGILGGSPARTEPSPPARRPAGPPLDRFFGPDWMLSRSRT